MAEDKVLKDAQYRKNLSIAFFNSTNSAIEMVKLELELNKKTPVKKVTKGKKTEKSVKTHPVFSLEDRIDYWRNHFLDKHKEYHATVIANIGVPYRSEDSIALLKAAKTFEELQTIWRQLSADERRDGEIKKVAHSLRDNLKKGNEKV